MIEPGKIPQFSGNLELVETASGKLTSAGPKVTSTGASVHNTFQGLSHHYIAPESADLFASTAPVKSKASHIGGQITSVGGALSTYVTEMRPIAAKLASLKTDAQTFVDDVGDDDDWRKDGDKVNQHNDMLNDVGDQVVAMMAVERKCANAIEALIGGRQWKAGDNPDDPNVYGPSDIPDNAEVPWGKPEEKDEPWWKDTLNAAGSYLKGVWVDGAWGMIKGLGTLIPVMPLLGSLGVPGMPSWSDAGNAWKGLGLTVAGLALWSSPISGALYTAAANSGHVPGWYRDFVNASNEAVVNFGKSTIAWDMWGKDPARAAGATVFNIATFFIPGPKGTGGLLKGGGLADDAARAASFSDDAARAGGLVDDLAHAGSLADDLGRAGHLPSVSSLADDIGRTLDDVNFNGLDDLGTSVDDLGRVGDDALPPGRNPGDEVPVGPADDLPPGANPGDDLPPGANPGDDLPPGANPGDDLPPGANPGDDLPPGANPGDDLPPGANPGDDVPPVKNDPDLPKTDPKVIDEVARVRDEAMPELQRAADRAWDDALTEVANRHPDYVNPDGTLTAQGKRVAGTYAHTHLEDFIRSGKLDLPEGYRATPEVSFDKGGRLEGGGFPKGSIRPDIILERQVRNDAGKLVWEPVHVIDLKTGKAGISSGWADKVDKWIKPTMPAEELRPGAGLPDDAARSAPHSAPGQGAVNGWDDAGRSAVPPHGTDPVPSVDDAGRPLADGSHPVTPPHGGGDPVPSGDPVPGGDPTPPPVDPLNPTPLDGDWRYGPERLPDDGPVGPLVEGYDRFGGLTKDEFVAKYWDESEGYWKFPDHDGFAVKTAADGSTHVARGTHEVRTGEIIDRFGGPDGGYLSPEGAAYGDRAIPPNNLAPNPRAPNPTPWNYHQYEVVRPFKVDAGEVAPWFEQTGGGVQYMLDGKHFGGATDVNVTWLLDNGYLREVPAR
ncbi:MAG: DUF4237 domain-containing protein [Streptosporangiales bacterium]|nr:DUF4237 domain-containing protein [Streptosporangiales bacterium]